MATYLFTWNPRKWDWKNLDQQVKICNRAGHVLEGWSCGLRKNIQPGDRAFMLCQGKGPRGIMASGRVVTDREEHRHWDKSKAKLGRKATVVDIDWDVLINPMKGPIFVRARLNDTKRRLHDTPAIVTYVSVLFLERSSEKRQTTHQNATTPIAIKPIS